MSYRFFLIPVRNTGDAASELNAFLGNHRVLAVERRWVDQGADSYWAFCVDYFDSPAGMSEKSRGARTRGKDYREILNRNNNLGFRVATAPRVEWMLTRRNRPPTRPVCDCEPRRQTHATARR